MRINFDRITMNTGETNLNNLLRFMAPKIQPAVYVFCTIKDISIDYSQYNPISVFIEPEGISLIIDKDVATKSGLEFNGTYRQITLSIHSSLDAVGLTAAVSAALAKHKISANVIAAYFHDHIFVQSENATKALEVLRSLSNCPDHS